MNNEEISLANERYYTEKKFILCLIVIVWTLVMASYKMYPDTFTISLVLSSLGIFVGGDIIEKNIKK